ncbi:MAG: arginyl-tRNA synthetase [Candidatus Paceibacteria bacterium]|jgi:arginyl-tRNA synthetase
MIKETLKKEIESVLLELGFEAVSVELSHPQDFSHGDYAANTALILSKKEGRNPIEVAGEIVDLLKERDIELISKDGIQIAGPGFINFTLEPEFFVKETREIVSAGEGYGKSDLYKGKKILVEHSSPNLFKPFHVGHVMNNAIGESISRLSKFASADTTVISFPSDISLGVAKAIFILLEEEGEDFTPTDVAVLGGAYVKGTKRYEEDESVQPRVREIADNLYAKKDSPELKIFESCKDFNIQYFEKILKRLGTDIDSYIYESEAGVTGAKMVKENKTIFTESDGAVVYIPSEEDKHLNTAVFINSQGNPTYEAKDLGLLKLKFDRYSPDISVFMTDSQQISHFQVVLDAAEKIDKEWRDKSVHRYHGRMSFKGQKMSSRLGGVPLATDLLESIHNEVSEKNTDADENLKDQISIAALKFTILKSQAGKNINFDPETDLSFEGDTGPYIQYTIARSNSVLVKAEAEGIKESFKKDGGEITDVERLLYRFGEVAEVSARDWAPHHLVNYGLELARAFNSFYGNTKLVDTENNNAGYNLSLVKATSQVLKNTLFLLGIESPEKM